MSLGDTGIGSQTHKPRSKMKTWQSILLNSIFCFLIAGVIFLIAVQPRGVPIKLSPRPTPEPIIVSVQGAVLSPGLYTFADGKRVQDAIDAAGGFLPEANRAAINLASRLHDEQQIVVPANNVSTTAKTVSDTSLPVENVQDESGFPININTATSDQLQKLPGIGPTRADAIIDYREKNGNFSKIDAIQNVKGIGPSTYDQIKALICVED